MERNITLPQLKGKIRRNVSQFSIYCQYFPFHNADDDCSEAVVTTERVTYYRLFREYVFHYLR